MTFASRLNVVLLHRWPTIRSTVALLLALSCLHAQDALKPTRRRLVRERDVETGQTWQSPPVWGGGKAVWFDKRPSQGPAIYTADRDGRTDSALFTIPNSTYIQIFHVAASRDGEVAVVGSALTAEGRHAAFLARVSADRSHQVLTRLSPYQPFAVVFAPDNSIWTIGLLKAEDETRDLAFHVLRRFDPSGKMLESRKLNMRGPITGESVSPFQASRDRVSLFTQDGEYIEFSTDGSEIGRYEGPDGVPTGDDSQIWLRSSMAISDNNQVVVGRFGKGKAEFVTLDREKRTWDPIEIPKEHSPKWARALGFDGETLVTSTSNGLLTRFKNPN